MTDAKMDLYQKAAPKWLRNRVVRSLLCFFMLTSGLAVGAYASDGLNTGDEVHVLDTLSKPYREAMRLILTEAGFDATYVQAPNRRGRTMFVRGQLNVECCITPIWRDWPEEQDIQLFSEPFYSEKTVLVGLEGHTFSVTRAEDLKNLRVAIIGGFGYEQMEYFGMILGVPTFDDLARLVVRGRADAAVIGEPEFLWQNSRTEDRLVNIATMEEYALRFRVHKSRPELIPKLNEAIARLKNCGSIKRILEQLELAQDVLNDPRCPHSQ